MSGLNQIPEHMQCMGMLVVNLQSLEFALRGFLYNGETGWTSQDTPNFLENITQGEQVEENAFTDYDTLAELIGKYNKKVGPVDSRLEVDSGIARIRDALAHGRIAGLSPSLKEPLRLVKYDRPANGLVHVTDFYILTREWFDEKIRLAFANIKKVSDADARFRSAP